MTLHVPQLLRRNTARDDERDDQLAELDRELPLLREYVLNRLAGLAICDGCFDRDAWRPWLDEFLNEATHEFRRRNEEG